ncbi:unnamed protein product [Paramecium octaurelia]|uniref:Uncharacterized protein n=1 Tax=Paramecium octaurelia TaxID=43137 RepID=A0A8S1TLU4_PAROT|nr:unnamed protein product [Paramecium octaurelia]
MNPNASRLKFQPAVTLNKRTFDLDLFELEKINFLNKMDKMLSQINSSQEIRTPTFNTHTEIHDNKAKLVDLNSNQQKKVLFISTKIAKKLNKSKTSDVYEQSTLPNTQLTTYQ